MRREKPRAGTGRRRGSPNSPPRHISQRRSRPVGQFEKWIHRASITPLYVTFDRALPTRCARAYNRSARCLALNWSPLVGADSRRPIGAETARRDAARRAATPRSSCCTPCLRSNPQPLGAGGKEGTVLSRSRERTVAHRCPSRSRARSTGDASERASRDEGRWHVCVCAYGGEAARVASRRVALPQVRISRWISMASIRIRTRA